MANELMAGVAPVSRRVRAFFAPVNRVTGQATAWDPANIASFDGDAPLAPWVDLGWCSSFTRTSATKDVALFGGAPGTPLGQVRTEVETTVALRFESWGKLQLALASGVQQMNVLRTQPGAAANGSGGTAVAAVALNPDSTATQLDVGSAAGGFVPGEIVAVDVDYTAQTGFVGSGVSGGFVKSAAMIGSDVDYVRRVTLNVGRVIAVNNPVLTLGAPLLAGAPTAAMRVSHVASFCDREGGSFFQEWSALFVLEGEQGDCIAFHYPRLQAALGAAESYDSLPGQAKSDDSGLARVRLAATFRALPVKDANDGEKIVCFRSYLPGALRAV